MVSDKIVYTNKIDKYKDIDKYKMHRKICK